MSLASLAACFPQRVSPGGNGQSGALDFQIENSHDAAITVATGAEVELFVQRYDTQWQNCQFSKNAGGLTVQDNCTSLNNEPIHLLDVSCDGCSITHDVDQNGGVRFKVSSDAEGTATVHVDVQSNDSGATWGDSFALQFAKATRLAVFRDVGEADGTTYAALPGASFQWCPVLEGAGDAVLYAPPATYTVATPGDVVQLDGAPTTYSDHANCVAFHATNPGASTITFQAQAFSVSEPVKVADPNQIAAANLFELADDPTATVAANSVIEVGAVPQLKTTPLTGFTFTAYPQNLYLLSVLTMTDGSLALGGAGRYASSSEDLVSVWNDGADPEIARTGLGLSSVPEAVGSGTISATFGSVKVSIPFSVTSSSGSADGGTD